MERLAELREKLGLKQEDVAHAIGVHRTTYTKYERGTSEPDFATLIKIATFFHVSIDYLLGYDAAPDANIDLSADEMRVIFSMRQLNEEGRHALDAYITFLTTSERYTEETGAQAM